MNRLILLLLLLLKLTGCGYHPIHLSEKPTLSIPYAQGDREGLFTAALIKKIDEKGIYELDNQGEFVLKVELTSPENEVIGFRYDRSEITGKIEKNLMPTENRSSVQAKVSLYKRSSEETFFPPFTVTAQAEYDYIDVNSLRDLSFITPTGRREKVVTFSLGQLDSIEGGSDNALIPLYQRLAEKISQALVIQRLESTHPSEGG